MNVVGLDEVGRGCWAGPLVAGAVMLGEPIVGLADSKKLTKLQRQRLSKLIQLKAKAFGLGWVDSAEIDTLGLSKSVELAMRRALECITLNFDRVVIDGNINYLANDPRSVAVIKADDSVPEVSAASIIAKVARDAWMSSAAVRYPAYRFDKHVGYGTKLHLQMLQKVGVCQLHRRSFKPIKSIVENSVPSGENIS